MWILRSSDDAEGGPYKFRLTGNRERILGRDPRSDFMIQAAFVSRRHCRLLVSDGELVVENLGSRNGTFINDQPVARGALKAGDRLRAGRIEFTVSTE